MSVRVLDTATGDIREVEPGPELEEGLRAGAFQLSSETTSIGMVDAEGNAYDVEPSALGEVLADGRFRLETNAERSRADAARLVDENPVAGGVIAFGGNALNELTFGLTAGAAGDVGRAADEANPTLATAGTIAGIVAPAIVSGGTSLGGTAARGGLRTLARLTPSGMTAAAGSAVERALIARFGQGAGSRALATVGGAVTDGGLSGLASAITNANITGEPLQAEQVMSDVLFGAALGLGGGGLVVGGGAALRGAGRLARGVSGTAERGAQYAERLVSRGLGDMPAPTPTQAQRVAAWASGVDAEDLARIASNPQRAFDAQGFARAAEEASGTVARLRQQLDDVGAAVQDASRRRAALVQAAEGADDAVARATARTALEATQGRVRQALEAVAGDGRTAGSRALRQVASETDAALAAVDDAATAGTAAVQLDAVVASVDDAIGRAGDDATRAVLTEVRQQLATVAGDATVLGGAGARWAELDGARQALASARGVLDMDGRRLATIARLESAGIDAAPARAAVQEARERLAGVTEWGRLRGAAERGLAAEDGAGMRQTIVSMLGRQVSGVATGAIVGTMFGGDSSAGALVGGGAGALLGALTNPVTAYRRIGQLGDTIRRYTQRMDGGVDRIRRVLESGRFASAGAIASSSVRTAARVVIGLRGTPEQRRAEYQAVAHQVRTMALDPDALGAQLGGTVAPVAEASPQLADGMTATAVRGVQYLASTLPAADTPALFDGGAIMGQLEPSQWEVDAFLRRFEAVEDPLSILDRAADGSLHVEHREAVQAVYPEIYADMQARLTEVIGQLDTRPPYDVRLQLGTLMGVPADRTLEPSFIAAMQSRYSQTTKQHDIIHGAEREPRPVRIDSTASDASTPRTTAIDSRL
jgi:methylphosphotriester-DNA--protein-cysteine methyltransferase